MKLETKEATYEKIGEKAGLSKFALRRFVTYMNARWADSETTKCLSGYAAEWALRFAYGDEFACSDSRGLAVLHQMEVAEQVARKSEMSQPNMTAELMDRAESYWNYNPASRASLLVDSGYSLALALNFFDTPFKNLNALAQRAVTKTVTLMFDEVK